MTSTTTRRPRGFTLVELIIVIAIITLLMTMLVVFITSAVKRGQVAKVQGMVKILSDACAAYKLDFGSYPPSDKGTRGLHQALGSPRLVSVQKGSLGDIKAPKPPLIEFDPSWLKDGGGTTPDAKTRPVPLVDAWENELRYLAPGKWNKGGVDIWSTGPNGKDELDPNHPDFDDITNWTKEN